MAMTVAQIKTNIALAAKFAYGSGMTEKTKGGEGNIGFLNGRIFKFNTHSSERGGPVTDAMRASCSQLRAHLGDLAQKLLAEEHNNGSMTQAAFQNEMKRIRTMLGLNADDGSIVDKGLLSRKVVAKVVTRLGKVTNTNFWDMRSDDAVNQQLKFGDDEEIHTTNDLSSKGKATHFTGVAEPMIKQMAAKYVETNKAAIGDFAKSLHAPIQFAKNDKKGFSEENSALLEGVLRKSVEDYIAKHGPVPGGALNEGGALRGPGTTYDAILKLADPEYKDKLLRTISYANCLSPAAANAFLRACALIRDTSFGTPERLYSVAEQLAKLPEGKFTPPNILKLAAPDLPIPSEIKNAKGALTKKQIDAFYRPIKDLYDNWDGAMNTVTFGTLRHFQLSQFAQMIDNGFSYTDLKTCLNHPEKFSVKMIPPTVFFACADLHTAGVKNAHGQSIGDISRQRNIVKIERNPDDVDFVLTQKLQTKEGQEKKLPGSDKTYAEEYLKQIEDLCGPENKLQQQLVFYHVSQNTAISESVMTGYMGYGRDPARLENFTIRKDQETGDVLVTKEMDKQLNGGLSLTVRIRPDGSQSVEGLIEKSGSVSSRGTVTEQMLMTIRSAGNTYVNKDGISLAMTHLDKNQTKLLAEFLEAQFDSQPTDVDDAAAKMKDYCKSDAAVAIFDRLANVCQTMSSDAVTRYLQMLLILKMQAGAAEAALGNLLKGKPEAFESDEAFATELNRRLGQGDELSVE